MHSPLFRLRSNQDGVAAVEFALILPILLLLFFGAVELSNLLIADSKLRAASAGMSDLVTQKSNGVITANDLGVVLVAAREIMRPLPTSDGGTLLAALVTSYHTVTLPNGTTSTSVAWTRLLDASSATPLLSGSALGLSNPTCSDSGNLPTGLATTRNDVVRVEAVYRWRPWFAFIFNTTLDLHTVNYNMPRYSTTLTPGTGMTPPCSG